MFTFLLDSHELMIISGSWLMISFRIISELAIFFIYQDVSCHLNLTATIWQNLCCLQSEKLLGSLGGLFSKAWRPKRNQQIKGPVSESMFQIMSNLLDLFFAQLSLLSCGRQLLCEDSKPRGTEVEARNCPNTTKFSQFCTNYTCICNGKNPGLSSELTMKCELQNQVLSSECEHGFQLFLLVQAEKEEQDDALADLSNTLRQLKEMSVDMGTEIDR